jgi:hypothetical protein
LAVIVMKFLFPRSAIFALACLFSHDSTCYIFSNVRLQAFSVLVSCCVALHVARSSKSCTITAFRTCIVAPFFQKYAELITNLLPNAQSWPLHVVI